MGCNRLTTERELSTIKETASVVAAAESLRVSTHTYGSAREYSRKLANLTRRLTAAEEADKHNQVAQQAHKLAEQAERAANRVTDPARRAELRRRAEEFRRLAQKAGDQHRAAVVVAGAGGSQAREAIEQQRSDMVARLYESYMKAERQLQDELYSLQPDVLERLRALHDLPRPLQASEPPGADREVGLLSEAQRREWDSAVAEARNAQQEQIRSYDDAKNARQDAQQAQRQADVATDPARKIELQRRANRANERARKAERRYVAQRERVRHAANRLTRLRTKPYATSESLSMDGAGWPADWSTYDLRGVDARTADRAPDRSDRDAHADDVARELWLALTRGQTDEWQSVEPNVECMRTNGGTLVIRLDVRSDSSWCPLLDRYLLPGVTTSTEDQPRYSNGTSTYPALKAPIAVRRAVKALELERRIRLLLAGCPGELVVLLIEVIPAAATSRLSEIIYSAGVADAHGDVPGSFRAYVRVKGSPRDPRVVATLIIDAEETVFEF